jgi:hypothetical protein
MKNQWKLTSVVISLLFTTGQAGALSVAVVDSGVNPTAYLAPAIDFSAAYDWTTGNNSAWDSVGHGTTVAEIIRGYSPGSTIVPIKIGNAAPSVVAIYYGIYDAAGFFAHSSQDVRVLNLSLGTGLNYEFINEAIYYALTRNIVIVIAAGNDGIIAPGFPAAHAGGWGDGVLAVGAVDGNNQMKSYSNLAGPYSKNQYVVVQWVHPQLEGTSFTAPMVSSLAANILLRWPHLTNRNVGKLICDTAIDLGAAGNDSTFGCGLVHPFMAISPVGLVRAPTGNSATGGSRPLTVEALQLTPALGFALVENSTYLGQLIGLDDYGRDYPVNVRSLISFDDGVENFRKFISSFRGGDSLAEFDFGRKGSLQFRLYDDNPAWTRRRPEFGKDIHDEEMLDLVPGIGIEHPLGDGIELALSYNLDPGHNLGWGIADNETSRLLLNQIDTGYLGFSDRANSIGLHYSMGDQVSFDFGSVQVNENEAHGQSSTAWTVGSSIDLHRNTRLGIRFSNLVEEGSLLGGSSSGAFSVDGAMTRAIGFSLEHRINTNTGLIAHYAYGQTEITNGSSLLDGISDLRHEAMGLGLFSNEVLSKGDRFGIALTRPLRIIDGSANLKVPYSRDIDGTIYSHTERVSLVPKDTETTIELFYRRPVSSHTDIVLHAGYRDSPFHSGEIGDDYTVFAAMKTRF